MYASKVMMFNTMFVVGALFLSTGVRASLKEEDNSSTSPGDLHSVSTTEHIPSSTSTVEPISGPSSTSTTPPTSTTGRTKVSSSTSTTTSTTPDPNDWIDLSDDESEKLVRFIVKEIQKLKVEHKELDDCQELDLSSVLSGKKQVGKPTKYSVTLKVQPQLKAIESCQKQNATMINMHPEICEADILEGDRGGTLGKTLIRSTCLQVEELQD